jgi:multiple sugar transport system ATP-binding protein
MNLISGEVMISEGSPRFTSPGLDQPLPARLAAGAQRSQGRGVILGIRPESIVVRGDGVESPPRGASWISAPVYIFEPLGSDQFLTLDVGGARVRVRTTPDLVVRAGDRLDVAFDPAKLHLFDRETGASLIV